MIPSITIQSYKTFFVCDENFHKLISWPLSNIYCIIDYSYQQKIKRKSFFLRCILIYYSGHQFINIEKCVSSGN